MADPDVSQKDGDISSDLSELSDHSREASELSDLENELQNGQFPSLSSGEDIASDEVPPSIVISRKE